MASLALLAAAMVAIAIMLVFIGLGRLVESRASVSARVEALAPLPTPADLPAGGRSSGLVQTALGALQRIVPQGASSASIATELARANLALTVTEYMLITLGSGIALFTLVFILLRQPLVALLAGLAGLFLPRTYVRRLQAKHLVAFQEQLPDILTLLVGSLRSGYGVTASMDMVAQQMPPPASDEFARVVREISLGASSAQALANLVRRMRSDDLELIVTAIGIQYEVGGNLATILDTISSTIRERVRLKGQLRILTSQAYLQRTILTALPVVVGLIVYVLNPQYMGALLTPGPWLLIPVFAVVSLAVGYVVMGKLSQIEF